jgi:hypothetical protein
MLNSKSANDGDDDDNNNNNNNNSTGVLLKKLTVLQLVKKFPAFYWTPEVHYRVHSSLPLVPIPSQINPV